MADKTGIEWTDATWNPIRGCSRVSEGCRNCYAEATAYRFSGPGQPYEGLVQVSARLTQMERLRKWNGQIKFVEEHLLDPLRWNPVVELCRVCAERVRVKLRPFKRCTDCRTRVRRIFVNSMSDLFHENVTDEMRDRIFAVMALCPQHTFQVLTKRPERMLAYLSDPGVVWRIHSEILRLIEARSVPGSALMRASEANNLTPSLPLPNVQLGVSVENQKAADDRLDYLCELGSQRWNTMVSFEPLLGPVDPGPWWLSLGKKTWAIVGGESGPGARPMHPVWARELRDQCVAAGVPFFFKQWGEWTPGENVDRVSGSVQTATWFDNRWSIGLETLSNDEGHRDDEPDLYRVGKKAAGHLLDGMEWHQFPEKATA